MKRADGEAPIADPARIRAFRTGLSAEARAGALLMAKGFRILARRVRTPVGEIDLIARRGGLLVFVEVKARAQLDDAAFSLTPRQMQRIVAAAEFWLAAHDGFADMQMRFDAILIAPRRLPRHIKSAFDAST